MVRFKGFQEIVIEMLERLTTTQPLLDTKPGSVSRDLFIDGTAEQVASINELLRELSKLQSVANLSGEDLTNYGSNYGVLRKTGTKSNGSVLFTFRGLSSNITIPSGTIVSTRNGISFYTVTTSTVRTSDINALRATATRFRNELDTAGVTDTLAIEITVEAQNTGSISNISTYSIIRHNAPGVNGVTNIISFSGGSDLESDSSFRSRILSRFAGANTGTTLGYRSTILALPDTEDALVVEPGDVLMTRDGSQTSTNSDDEKIITQPGMGGKVDIYVLGENLQSGTDGFIYKESSGTKDPTNTLNDYVLGQGTTSPDENLTISSKRLSVLTEGAQIPIQPISNIVSVSGSSSGSNFIEQYKDGGGLKGNYKLIKDIGYAGGSPFGLDKLVWTSNKINLLEESRTKGLFNGIDGLSFTDVVAVNKIQQDISVINENSTIFTSDRSVLTLNHSPIRTVNRVFNLSTGERYTIINQNLDGEIGSLNTTKRIQISGRTLPTASNTLQVDYLWTKEFDINVDFDSMNPKDELSEAQDSIDWGFSNYIRDEETTAVLDSYNNLTASVTYPISRLFSVNTYKQENKTVTMLNGSKVITVDDSTQNVHKITDIYGTEFYKTTLNDGNYSHKLITLPTDTLANNGDNVSVIYNINDIIAADGYDSASVIERKITIFPYTKVSSGTQLLVNYIADFFELIPNYDLDKLQITSDGFNSFNEVDGYQPVQDLFSGTTAKANMRRSPSQLNVSVADISTEGILEFVGTTFNKVDAVYIATADNNIDISLLIKNDLGISRSASLPIGVYIGKVVLLQKVQVDSSGTITSTDYTYDLMNYSINDNRFDLENAIKDSTLERGKLELADVAANTDITTGTYLRVIFYYMNQNDRETLFFSKSGSAITDKAFAKINTISRVSGFTNSVGTVSGSLSIDSINQPDTNSAYLVDYDYTAPKENERITINYEYNKLIQDATYEIESTRPITADVLVKEATKITIDVTASIIVLPSYETSKENVKQDVADNISGTISATTLGSTIDASDIINNTYNVAGLDRITINIFNKTGATGTKKSLVAEKNEYFAAGTITVTVENR